MPQQIKETYIEFIFTNFYFFFIFILFKIFIDKMNERKLSMRFRSFLWSKSINFIYFYQLNYDSHMYSY